MMYFIIIVLLISLLGWVLHLNKRLTKVEYDMGIKEIKPQPKKEKIETEEGKEVSFYHKGFLDEKFLIRAKVISTMGNQYLVQYIESYPAFRYRQDSPFNNNRLLISKDKMIK